MWGSPVTQNIRSKTHEVIGMLGAPGPHISQKLSIHLQIKNSWVVMHLNGEQAEDHRVTTMTITHKFASNLSLNTFETKAEFDPSIRIKCLVNVPLQPLGKNNTSPCNAFSVLLLLYSNFHLRLSDHRKPQLQAENSASMSQLQAVVPGSEDSACSHNFARCNSYPGQGQNLFLTYQYS